MAFELRHLHFALESLHDADVVCHFLFVVSDLHSFTESFEEFVHVGGVASGLGEVAHELFAGRHGDAEFVADGVDFSLQVCFRSSVVAGTQHGGGGNEYRKD